MSNTITIVSRVTIKWPANVGVVQYLKRYTNLAHPGDTIDQINWSKTSTWSIPVINEFCLKKLAGALINNLENDIQHDGKILKVEIFDPTTHKLLIEHTA